MTLAMAQLRRDDPRRAARGLALGVEAYRGFQRLRRRIGAEKVPELLVEFEGYCRQVLGAFEPPEPAGKDPVRSLARLVRRLPRRRRRARPHRVIDAMDMLITAGNSPKGRDLDRKVVRDLARMLGGWVLLHYEEGTYLTLRPQDEHTLTTWSIHRLARTRAIRRRTVRPEPGYWRADQRRPRAILSFPIGEGTASIARMARFSAKEAKAVRTVLRFLEARRSAMAALPPAEGDGARPSLRPATRTAEGLVGRARSWRRVVDELMRVAPSDCSVVLRGDTGTGKERLARALHSASSRSQGPFVPVNCGAIAPDLLASELFGHIRGAFSGATRSRRGLIRRAHRGTLFLDEIADAPSPLQVALLRALEAGEIVPVGSARPRPVDVRVVCASHRDLQRAVRQGAFREDLYHRLNVVTIEVPALRDRIEDLPILAEHLLSRTPTQPRLHPDAVDVLMHHDWPGNVRELDNVLRAAALLVPGPEILPEDVSRLLQGRMRAHARAAKDPGARRRLGPRSEAALEALTGRWRSAPEVARDLGVSARTANRDIARLLHHGLVLADGAGRARRYRRADGI